MYVDWAKPQSMDAPASQKDLSPVCHGHHDSEWSGLHPAVLNPEQGPSVSLERLRKPNATVRSQGERRNGVPSIWGCEGATTTIHQYRKIHAISFEIGHNNEICKPFRDELRSGRK